MRNTNTTMKATTAVSVWLCGLLVFALSRLDVVAGTNLLILHSENRALNANLIPALNATGEYATIDTYDAFFGTPSNDYLNSYHAILVFSYADLNNVTAMGNAVGQYIEQGGGVVLASFSVGTCCYTTVMQGSFMANYQAIGVTAECFDRAATSRLGVKLVLPDHALAQGFVAFNDSNAFNHRPTCTALAPGAYVVARWSDGLHAVVVRDNLGPHRVSRVDLGFYPIALVSDVNAMALVRAALRYVIETTSSSSSPLFSSFLFAANSPFGILLALWQLVF